MAQWFVRQATRQGPRLRSDHPGKLRLQSCPWPIPLRAEALVEGAPDWSFGGLSPASIRPLELGFLGLGLLGSLLVAHRIALREHGLRAARVALPWAALIVLLAAAAVWLLFQPMEMRGTFLAT